MHVFKQLAAKMLKNKLPDKIADAKNILDDKAQKGIAATKLYEEQFDKVCEALDKLWQSIAPNIKFEI